MASAGELLIRIMGDSSNAIRSFLGIRTEVDNLPGHLQRAGDKMKGIGTAMSAAITAPILAAGGMMLKGALDAESAIGKLQAQLGITSQEAADLGNVAKGAWKSGFGQDIEQATESVRQVRLNMGALAKEEMQSVTEGAMVISDVFGAEVTDSTKAAGTMIKNFGISGQDALDLITVGFQKGGDYSGELLDTLNEYSPQFASMGMSADQMMGILVAGANAGAFSLDKVGDAVKEFNIRAQDGSKGTAEGFTAIGLDATKMGADIAAGGDKAQQAFMATIASLAAMKDPVAQNTAGVALFGTQWEDVRSKVIVAMADGVKGVGDFKGATQEAAEAMKANNPGLAMTAAMREMQAVVTPVLLPLIDMIRADFIPSIQSLVEWFTGLSPAGQKTVLVIAGIAAAIGPLLMGFGAVSSAISGIIAIAPALGTAFTIATGPIGIAVAVIAALVAGGIALYQNWDTVKAKASELGQAVKTVFNNIRSSVSGLWSEAVTWGSNIIQGMVNGITFKLQSAKEAALSVATSVKDAITGFFDMRSPSKVTEELGRYIAEGLAKGIEKGTSEAEKAAEKMAQAVQGAVSLVLGDLDRTFQLASAGLELKTIASSNNITEIQRLKNELQKLQLELQQASEKVDVLNDIYEMTKAKLGENSQITKQYKHELEMAKIALEKLNIEISNNAVAQEQASIDQIIRRQKELFDKYSKALKEESEEIKKAYEERKKLIEAEIEADEELIRSKEELIDKLKEETDSRVKALQAQIEALEEEADTESRAEAEEEYNATIAELTEERNKEALYAGKEHKEKVEELDKQIAEAQKEWQEKQNEWAREDQEKALQDQIDAIEEEASIREDAIKDEIDDIKAANEKKRKELEKYYSEVQELISDSTLEMLAKLAMTNDQWYQQGIDWMRQLAQGMAAGSTELPLGASEFLGGVQAQGSSGGNAGTPQLIASIGPGQYINANGTTYMASRDLAGMLDQPVEWDQVNQRVKIGTQWFTPWKVEDGTSYVGIREVAEALGYTVGWDDSNVKIYKAAKGGIFHRPAITQIAEAGGSEVAAPLSTLLPMMRDTLIDALMSIGPKFSSIAPSPAMAGGGDTIINLTFPGPIIIRSDDDIVQISNRLGGLVRSTQRGVGRR